MCFRYTTKRSVIYESGINEADLTDVRFAEAIVRMNSATAIGLLPRRAPRLRGRLGGLSCLLPRHVGYRYPTSRIVSRFSSSSGNRTPLSALKGQYPGPIDERAVCATVAQWVRWRSNPRLRVFSPALIRLSYRPKRKTRRPFVTPGFGKSSSGTRGRVSQDEGIHGLRIRR